MIDLTIKLIQETITTDEIGNKIATNTEIEVPIIKHEDIYSSEYYEAGTLGMKPTLRIRISALNYNNEKQLKYMNQLYEIIRVDTPTIDEKSLICERKIGNECE